MTDVKELREKLERAEREAEGLARVLHRLHYSEVKQWKPLSGDLTGLLSQIDNMTSGMVRSEAALSGTREAVEPMPPTADREAYDEETYPGYLVGDSDWAAANPEAITWLADNHAKIRAALTLSNPVGQRAVRPDLWDIETTAENIARRLAAIDGGRLHGDWYRTAKEAALEALTLAKNQCTAELSALSPAPEARSDEVERMDALSPPDHILDQVQEAMDERSSMGCKVFVSDVLDELRRALSDAAEGGQ